MSTKLIASTPEVKEALAAGEGYREGVAYALEHVEAALAAAKRAWQRNTTIVLEDLVHTLKLECEE